MIKDINRPLLYRLLKIHNLLKIKKYVTLEEMAEECGMSARNTARDIRTMRDDLGLDLAYSKEKGKYYYENDVDNLKIPPIKFTAGELLAILLAEKVIPQLDKKFKKAVDNVLNKIRFLAPEETNVSTTEMIDLFSVDLKPTAELSDKNDSLIKKAMKNKKTLNITYFSPHNIEETIREIEPYAMHFTLGNWYLIGHCQLRKEIRTFSIDNIKEIEITKNSFVKPADFTVEKYMGNAWGIVKGQTQKVKIKFAPTIAQWVINKKWLKGQKATLQKDGSAVMEFSVDGLDEIARWVLSFGEKATVVSPKELKQLILDKAKAIVENNC